jgi:ABC-type cobalamin/Fe3+-siderophores transport system ATPase subunit
MMIGQGRIVSFGLPPDVMTEQNIREVYGVEVKVFREDDEIYAIPKRSIRQ